MATDFDPYRILGIDRTAFSDDIYEAYQRALAAHPNDGEALREIEAAYAILGNLEQRREYDRRVTERESAGYVPATPEAVEAAGGTTTEVRWTLGDMGKALILPMLLIGLNVIATLTVDVDEEELTEAEYTVGFGFSFLVQGVLLALAYHFGIRKYGLSWRAFGFHWPRHVRWWFPLAVTAAALLVVRIYIWVLIALGVDDTEGNLPSGAYDYLIPVILLGLLSICVAPLVEEVFFRGFLYQGFAKRWGVSAGIAISAVIFGLIHISGTDSLIVAPAIALIGGIFAWAVARTGSIYPSVIAHLIFNAISFMGGFFLT